MSKASDTAKMIKQLTPAKGFTVSNSNERQYVFNLARSMRSLGVIDFKVVSRTTKDGLYKIAAV